MDLRVSLKEEAVERGSHGGANIGSAGADSLGADSIGTKGSTSTDTGKGSAGRGSTGRGITSRGRGSIGTVGYSGTSSTAFGTTSNITSNPTSNTTSSSLQKYSAENSAYTVSFCQIVSQILSEDRQLFTDEELEYFNQYFKLSKDSQFLYVRLFLRKQNRWFRLRDVGNYKSSCDVENAIEGLIQEFHVTNGKPKSRSFASSLKSSQTSLEDLLKLLLVPELKILIGKHSANGTISSRPKMIDYLLKSTKTQQRLVFSSGFADSNDSKNLESRVLKLVGTAIRLDPVIHSIFQRALLVFFRTRVHDENPFDSILLANMKINHYYPYKVRRSPNFFASRRALLDYETAVNASIQTDIWLESRVGKVDTAKARDLFKVITENVIPLLQAASFASANDDEPPHEIIYTADWVNVGCAIGLSSVIGDFQQEWKLLDLFLSQYVFHRRRRGDAYQRKALIEMTYFPSATANFAREICSDDNPLKRFVKCNKIKTFWLNTALNTCISGIEDSHVHPRFKYDLRKRIQKLEKQLIISIASRRDFSHEAYLTAKITVIVREKILLEDPNDSIQLDESFLMPTEPAGISGGPSNQAFRDVLMRRTLWLDPDTGDKVSVEEVSLRYYKKQGWNGYHSENSILPSIFALLCWDVIFSDHDGVFQHPYQAGPLDMNTKYFFRRRREQFEQTIAKYNDLASALSEISRVYNREYKTKTICQGMEWSYSLQEFLDVATCLGAPAIVKICTEMSKNYRFLRSGMPDLCLWNIDRKAIMFSEVKSENDFLSDKQHFWIDLLVSCDVPVELCRVLEPGRLQKKRKLA